MTSITRLPAQIVERIKSMKGDTAGLERSRLLEALPWADAQQFLNPANNPHTQEKWEAQRARTITMDGARALITGYLPFAWKQANSRRMVSAYRSAHYFQGLLWLIGTESAMETYQTLHELRAPNDRYEFFGKVMLAIVSNWANFPWEEHDNDQWYDDLEEDAKEDVKPISRQAALERLAAEDDPE